MRIVFMGTPDFAVPVLSAVADAGHTVVGVVTQPDRPKGRGGAVLMTPVKQKALALGFTVYQPQKVREPEFVELLRGLAADVFVVAAFGQILAKSVLELPRLGCVNVHSSLLPKYRGAAPIQWAIIDGERETGVTTMLMNEGLDTGDMLEQAAVPIEPDDTGGSLHDKLSALGAELIVSTLRKLENGTAVRTPQTDEGTCYAKMLTKTMGDIDWTMDAEAIERLVRGLSPWPGTYTGWNGRTLKIWKAQIVPDGDGEDFVSDGAASCGRDVSASGSDASCGEEFFTSGPGRAFGREASASGPGRVCGQVVLADKNRLYVRCGKGLLSLTELQPEGKKRMETAAFLRGYPVETGTVFVRSREAE